VTLF